MLKPAYPDRGLDNWMIKICWHNHDTDDTHSHVNGASAPGTPNGKQTNHSPLTKPVADQPLQSPALVDIRTSISRTATPQPGTPTTAAPHIHIGAIDNSLAFPWKHPDEWRSFPLYNHTPNVMLIIAAGYSFQFH